MILNLTLTEEEANALLQLMDAGLKNQHNGGLPLAWIATVIMQKLQESRDLPKHDAASVSSERGEMANG